MQISLSLKDAHKITNKIVRYFDHAKSDQIVKHLDTNATTDYHDIL